ATSLKTGDTVVISRDSSRAARMLKRSFMAGLNAGGIDVLDLEMATVPLTRFLARQPTPAAGVTIRLVEDDPQSIVIRFFDSSGIDITADEQRKIERLFDREDFRRVFAAEIGDIAFPARAGEQYVGSLEETVDVRAIRERKFKL